jgi:Transcriptional regulator, AbiEi antitoxin
MSYSAVMARYPTLTRLAKIAEDQWGLVTRRQAERAGVSRATLQRLATTGVLDRVAQGVYRLTGAPPPDYLDLRAAWLQLAPDVLGWERTPEQGVVSHRSAAALCGLGHLPADRHEFTLPMRRQSRRKDVRLHHRPVHPSEWIVLHGMPVTRPSRIAADLLDDKEDPEAVAQVIADAIRSVYDYPGTFADALGPHAARFGFRRGDGLALLRWLLDTVGDPETYRWMEEARAHVARSSAKHEETLPAGSLAEARRR